MKLGLSNQAQFYRYPNVTQKVKEIEDIISKMLMDNRDYRNGFKNTLRKEGLTKPKPKEEKNPKEKSLSQAY